MSSSAAKGLREAAGQLAGLRFGSGGITSAGLPRTLTLVQSPPAESVLCTRDAWLGCGRLLAALRPRIFVQNPVQGCAARRTGSHKPGRDR